MVNQNELSKLVASCVVRGGDIQGCTAESNSAAGVETVAGVGISFMMFSFFEGKLGMIAFRTPSAQFEKISTAFIDNYGKATTDQVEPFTTKGGQTYENRELQWQLPAGIIRLKRLSGRLDASTVNYISPAGARAFGELLGQDRKKAASDL